MVLDLQNVGVDGPLAASLPGLIAQAIAAHPGFDVSSRQDVKDMLALEKTKALVGCTGDSACVTEIAKKVNADVIVNGSIGQLGQSLVLSLVLLDLKQPGKTQRASDTFESNAALTKGIDGTLGKLFGWSGAGPKGLAFHLPKGRKMSFAVFDLNASGVTPEIAKNLTQALSSEVNNIQGASVVSRDDILAMLQFDKEKAQLGCTEDTACMASIGGALGVDRLIVGSVGRVANESVINLRLIDARHATVENRHTESFTGSEDELIGATREAARELLGLEAPAPGKMTVTASQPAAEVFVDSEKVGKLPLPPIEKLAAGKHHVRLAKDGFFDWQSDLYVNPAETSSAWAALAARPQAWYQKWWVWTIAGVVVVAGAITPPLVINANRKPSVGTVGLGLPALSAATP